ncbi:MAG: rhodanese-like domain-containing protein, partial [Bacteroidetes bacterium]|nr:rhodanese-like domain-containing protein [Bacteroidota bacterium]
KTNRLKRIWILAIGAVLLASCGGATKVADATSIGSSAEPIEAQSTVPQPKAGEIIIVDVRTVAEWDNDGHANCTVNIPIDELESRMGELKKDQKVILVCRSGNRAGRAKQLLESAGFTQVENKGAWQNVECK